MELFWLNYFVLKVVRVFMMILNNFLSNRNFVGEMVEIWVCVRFNRVWNCKDGMMRYDCLNFF